MIKVHFNEFFSKISSWNYNQLYKIDATFSFIFLPEMNMFKTLEFLEYLK